MGELSWNILIVPAGYETIVIRRKGRVVERGTFPAGHAQHLMIGDVVVFKRNKWWAKKFRVCLRYGHPALHFGRAFGRKRDQYVLLRGLPQTDPLDWTAVLRENG